MDMADRLSEDGWRELGYVYINIDDCWSSMQRDGDGRLQADPKRYSVILYKTHTVQFTYVVVYWCELLSVSL